MMKKILKSCFFAVSLLAINIYSSEVGYNKDRYNIIKNAYDTDKKWFKEGFISQPQDIEIVQFHKDKELQPKLDNMQSIYTKIKRVFFGMLTTSFGLPAGLSGLASVGGAIVTPFALEDSPPYNPEAYAPEAINKMWEYMPLRLQQIVQQTVQSFTTPSYSDLLKHFYFKFFGIVTEPQQPPLSDIEGTKNFIYYHMRENFIDQLRPGNSPRDIAIALGLFAPITAFAAITFGVIAKYLWNKFKGYQKEIDNLNAQINLDNDIITALKSRQ